MSSRSHLLPDQPPLDVLPPPRARSGRRRPKHPIAIDLQFREEASRTSQKLATPSWRWRYNWAVFLHGNDGSRRCYTYPSYERAVEGREKAMKTGDFREAWIREENR